jgi:pimeloyl-ACP methyl ester carboxylesterase
MFGNSAFLQPLDKNDKLSPQSISEKIFVDVNGVKQGMFIKGKNINNPVLLYLHGGMPDYFLKQRYPTRLEDDFIVVWWEQRGSGISYDPSIPLTSITKDQLISDTLVITNYLRHRFSREKIFLMGHSGGTFIGIQTVMKKPELFEAYIGVSQMSNQLKSETLAYNYMLKRFKKEKNLSMVRKLEAAPVTMTKGVSPAYVKIRDRAMHILGIGTTHDMKSEITGLFLPSFMFREYTLKEKINMWRSKFQSGISVLSDTIMTTDLNKSVKAVNLPVYFFHGKYDYTVSYSEAKAYFKNLKAPIKGFYTFENSAHCPMFEEPEKMQKILRKNVLMKKNNLAEIK